MLIHELLSVFIGYIAFMVRIIKTALKSPKRRCRGFTVLELVEALARIAVSDHNKKRASGNLIDDMSETY